MFARVTTVAFEGIEARAVDVQVQVGPGMAAFTIVGLPDKAVAESRERVRGALNAIGLALPPKRITVNLAPADLPKEGSHNISALCQPPSCRCYSHSSPRSRQSPSVVAIQIHPRARTNGLPKVTFHSIRHSHASALIRGGLDVVRVSRQLGHSKPTITLSTYAHEFEEADSGAADAIAKLLR
jgi:hypothetical protein